jgi:Redoxin
MSSIIAGAAAAAHSTAASLLSSLPIKVGDQLPDVAVKEDDPETKVHIHKINNEKILIVSDFLLLDQCMRIIDRWDYQLGVPAAFSPPCGSQIPDYIERYQAFTAKGIKAIFVVAINDAFVTTLVPFLLVLPIQIFSKSDMIHITIFQSLEETPCK